MAWECHFLASWALVVSRSLFNATFFLLALQTSTKGVLINSLNIGIYKWMIILASRLKRGYEKFIDNHASLLKKNVYNIYLAFFGVFEFNYSDSFTKHSPIYTFVRLNLILVWKSCIFEMQLAHPLRRMYFSNPLRNWLFTIPFLWHVGVSKLVGWLQIDWLIDKLLNQSKKCNCFSPCLIVFFLSTISVSIMRVPVLDLYFLEFEHCDLMATFDIYM